jgi:RNA polymerase sigma-70 factor, ECF subfamily
VAVVLNAVPLDAMVARLGTNLNAMYKAVFDTRCKIRGFLVASGYLEEKRRGPS